MMPRIPADPGQRAERKANLLLASAVLRGQAVLAVDDLGDRADGLARRVLTLREWLSHPAVLAALGGGAAFFAGAGPRRRGLLWRGLRWAWFAWQTWGRRR
ncbi:MULTISPECIES: hypothetical protein [Roseateles]|uniref:YqjK-like protein n=1 Tax=Pelomonas caseinilytica TaxID=2906763 RepID=A0ABS8XNC2_9BURK|nr:MULTISPECIES: hypothetical protein [unclassified Roseateles]MCE4540163.1 hypothetical protein [Pelomonas sp. P7]HEV6964407.1 hypothetical protein [Roseateles sp.]